MAARPFHSLSVIIILLLATGSHHCMAYIQPSDFDLEEALSRQKRLFDSHVDLVQPVSISLLLCWRFDSHSKMF
jgi:hypothetical protein